jgi:hypothetical protein
MSDMSIEMQNHIERTRAQAAPNYEPRYTKEEAIQTVSLLYGAFGEALVGCAFATGQCVADDDPIPELSSEQTWKRGRGRPRKT